MGQSKNYGKSNGRDDRAPKKVGEFVKTKVNYYYPK